jgi:selenide,water dikinase
MQTLNRAAAEAVATLPRSAVHACTDITGFGLAGHGTGMARASRATLHLSLEALPVFQGVVGLAAQNRSGGLTTNEDHFAKGVVYKGGPVDASKATAARLPLIYDPQTSGGLLVAVDERSSEILASAFERQNVQAWRVGRVVEAIPHIHIHMV